MFELDAGNAAGYLGYPCSAKLLGGGVSNTVLLIEGGPASIGRRFILKQSLGKLRVEQDWFSERSRIFRECSAMRRLRAFVPSGALPEVLFEDRENYLFAMTAAPVEAEPWKDLLLRGEVDVRTAVRVAERLGSIIAATWHSADFEAEFGNQTIFDELRIDPYYRATAKRHPDLAPRIDRLMEESGRRRFSLVHGDWSPKNFLITGADVMAIDFEVVHYGDPSFDAAFLLNHLLLKSFYRTEWRTRYREAAMAFWTTLPGYLPEPRDWFEPAVAAHLGALLLARVDGKSPAEYVREDTLKAQVRHRGRELILSPRPVAEVFGVA